jgi:hypothetical protein
MNAILTEILLLCNVIRQVSYVSISNALHIIHVLVVQLFYRRYFLLGVKLTFKNRASYIQDGPTTTHQMLHFVFFFNKLKYRVF